VIKEKFDENPWQILGSNGLSNRRISVDGQRKWSRLSNERSETTRKSFRIISEDQLAMEDPFLPDTPFHFISRIVSGSNSTTALNHRRVLSLRTKLYRGTG
jgi:hypothetical protein